MQTFYSKFSVGDTVCLQVDVTAGLDQEEIEPGMITAITFTGTGAIYHVTWSDKTTLRHIVQELHLVEPCPIEETNPEEN